jgi:hypothetical protein
MRILLASLVLVLVLAGCGSQTSFDQDRWQNADLATRERAEMVDSLLENYPLEGMDRARAIALLGPPTPTDKWAGTDLIYVLGPEGGLMGIDYAWLLIDLGPQGRVSSYRVTTD